MFNLVTSYSLGSNTASVSPAASRGEDQLSSGARGTQGSDDANGLGFRGQLPGKWGKPLPSTFHEPAWSISQHVSQPADRN